MASKAKTYRTDGDLAARGELKLKIETEDDSYDVDISDTNRTNKWAVSRKQLEQREGIRKDYDVDRLRKALKATRGPLAGAP